MQNAPQDRIPTYQAILAQMLSPSPSSSPTPNILPTITDPFYARAKQALLVFQQNIDIYLDEKQLNPFQTLLNFESSSKVVEKYQTESNPLYTKHNPNQDSSSPSKKKGESNYNHIKFNKKGFVEGVKKAFVNEETIQSKKLFQGGEGSSSKIKLEIGEDLERSKGLSWMVEGSEEMAVPSAIQIELKPSKLGALFGGEIKPPPTLVPVPSFLKDEATAPEPFVAPSPSPSPSPAPSPNPFMTLYPHLYTTSNSNPNSTEQTSFSFSLTNPVPAPTNIFLTSPPKFTNPFAKLQSTPQPQSAAPGSLPTSTTPSFTLLDLGHYISQSLTPQTCQQYLQTIKTVALGQLVIDSKLYKIQEFMMRLSNKVESVTHFGTNILKGNQPMFRLGESVYQYLGEDKRKKIRIIEEYHVENYTFPPEVKKTLNLYVRFVVDEWRRWREEMEEGMGK